MNLKKGEITFLDVHDYSDICINNCSHRFSLSVNVSNTISFVIIQAYLVGKCRYLLKLKTVSFNVI